MSMTTFGPSVYLKGELRTSEDLTVEGRIDGPVLCEDAAIVVAPGGQIAGDVLARDITVFGRMSGKIIATDIVDVRPDATVTGQVISPRFILDEAAHFAGHVEPQHLEAALRVAKFNQRKRDA